MKKWHYYFLIGLLFMSFIDFSNLINDFYGVKGWIEEKFKSKEYLTVIKYLNNKIIFLKTRNGTALILNKMNKADIIALTTHFELSSRTRSPLARLLIESA